MKRFVMACLCLCLSLVVYAQQKLPAVHFNFGSTVFNENISEATTSSDFDFTDAYDGKVHRWVVFEKLPSHTQRQALESKGFEFLEYVRTNCYLMAIPTNGSISSLHSAGARSIQEMMRESKINLRIIDNDIPEENQVAGGISIRLVLFDNVGVDGLVERLATYKMTNAVLSHSGNSIFAEAPLSQIEQIALAPEIRYIDLIDPEGKPESIEGATMQRGNVLNNKLTGGLRLDGSGVAVLVNDDGFVGPHIDFTGRLTNEAGINTSPGQQHGDGVAGCMAAAGIGDPTVVAPASNATIFAKEYDKHYNDSILNYHLNNDVMVINTSYSNGCNAGYTSVTRFLDEMVYDHPSLTQVFSAGNSGARDCGYGAGKYWGNITGGHKSGKNVIAVANLDAAVELYVSSSRGPATDGRIKPDIAAHGQGQRSNVSDHRYRSFGGTSAAAPTAASTITQLYQAYREGHNGEDPKASLIKAVVMNSAQDLGNPGPDFKFGYGLVDAGRAYETLDENWYATATKNEGQFYGRYLFVPQNVVECRVMLYWADPPGSVNASQALVNDLDLVVRDGFAGDVQLPYVLNTTPNADSLNLPASNGEDHLNNMEQVVAAPPTSGFLWIEVDETALPMGPQEFHLVWTFIYDEIEITYPLGNEQISANEFERIHWNAYGDDGTFTVSLSTDNGGSWTLLATDVPGDQRSLAWTPTNISSSECLIRVSRNGQSSQSSETFHVYDRPDVLCVDQGNNASEALISWDPVPGAFAYRMYHFNGTNMVPFAETIMTEFTVDNIVANQDYHFAVAAYYVTGESQRSNAYFYRSDDEGTCPSCDVPLTLPYTESFESGFGTHCNPTCGDGFDWSIGVGGTPTSDTGPSAAFDGTSYALIEASAPNNYFVNADLESQCIQLPANAEMSFVYHMYGGSMGGLSLWISADDGLSWTQVWSRFGNQGNQWNQQTIDLSAYGGQIIKYRFQCNIDHFRSDIGVDDIEIVPTQPCVNQFPWSESFDSYATCTTAGGAQTCDIGGDWVQTMNGAGDGNDWRINSGGTVSGATGPQSDRSGSGNYAYVEASSEFGLTNILTTPCFDISGLANAEFSFYYHRYGANMGPLYVEVSDDGGSTWNLEWTKTGQQQTASTDAWLQAVIDISAYNGTISIRFRGVGGSNWLSDMAIDDISITDASSPIVGENDERIILFDGAAVDKLHASSTWSAEDVAVFPNPTMERFTAELPAFEGAMHWEIRNGQGRVVKQGETTSRSFDVDLSTCAAGHYIILLRDKNTTSTKQIVKL